MPCDIVKQRPFEIYMTERVEEALDAQDADLTSDRRALRAMAEYLGAELPLEPRVSIFEGDEMPHELDADELTIHLFEPGPIEESMLTRGLLWSLAALAQKQKAHRDGTPYWYGGTATTAAAGGLYWATESPAVAAAGSGLLLATALAMAHFENRRPETELPDIANFDPPIILTEPKGPRYHAVG